MEVCEAATQIGLHMGNQGKRAGRPIFGMFFRGQPLAVAVTVGKNGFVVGMNRQSYESMKQSSRMSRGMFEDVVQDLASWPRADPPVRRTTFPVESAPQSARTAARTKSSRW